MATAASSSDFAQQEEKEKEIWDIGGRECAVAGDLSSRGIEIDDTDDDVPAAAGLRPETAPASTPLDLGCKAYYMARNIGIRAVCTVRAVLFLCFEFYASLVCGQCAGGVSLDPGGVRGGVVVLPYVIGRYC